MAEVYEVYDLRENIRLAMKLISGGASNNPGGEEEARFGQEAHLASQLIHPGITRLYEQGSFKLEDYD
jgi:serine/threonine protein kinase